MILRKNHLLAMLLDLSDELLDLREKVEELEQEVHKPKPVKRGTNVDGVKKKPGRPCKDK